MPLEKFDPETDSLFNDVLKLPEHEKAAFFESEHFDKTLVYEIFNPGVEFKTTYRKKPKKIPNGLFTVSIEFAVFLLTKFSDHNRRFDKTNRFKIEKGKEPDKLGRRIYDAKLIDLIDSSTSEVKPSDHPETSGELKSQLEKIGMKYGILDGKETLLKKLAEYRGIIDKLTAANLEFAPDISFDDAKALEANLQ